MGLDITGKLEVTDCDLKLSRRREQDGQKTRAQKTAIVPVEQIASRIFLMRGHRVMLDSDLARLYRVSTKRLNEQVKRNQRRFPADFMFRLTHRETQALRSQFATSKPQRGGRRYVPQVFTEHGAAMLASVLNSPVAVQASIRVVRAFIQLREFLGTQHKLALKLLQLEISGILIASN